MMIRLLEMHRILKDTGSIYFHIDPKMSHYIKISMDAIFGRKNFLGEIVWNKCNGVKTRKRWGNENDNIIAFCKKFGKHTFNIDSSDFRVPFSDTILSMHFTHKIDGRTARIKVVNNKEYIYFADEGRFIGNLWNDTPSMKANSPIMNESTGFRTQKPVGVLERIIKASSNPGDLVLDPFGGCATTCISAEAYGREWVGVDLSPKQVDLVRQRIDEHMRKEVIQRTDLPQRTDLGEIPKYNCESNRKQLYGEQGGLCQGCHNDYRPKDLQVDHMVSKDKGGTDHIENLQLLCGNCNLIKGNRGMEYLMNKLQIYGQ